VRNPQEDTMGARNFLIVNNSGVDLRDFEREIAESLRRDGTLPEELADVLIVSKVAGGNPDGSPRFVIEAA
jgi:hypothetical protein